MPHGLHVAGLTLGPGQVVQKQSEGILAVRPRLVPVNAPPVVEEKLGQLLDEPVLT